MRRVALALFSTVAGLVMLLNFKTHSAGMASVPAATAPVVPGTGASAGTSSTAAGVSGTPSASASTGASSASSAASSVAQSSASKTVTGDAVDTRYGPVQIQITVQNGAITSVNAIVYPQNSPRDQEINSFAIPQLNEEALAARSAQIDMVSGATYTSEGYLSSLQSALDKAGL
jgi:uncharacterized protein with FMN-binding domain